MHYRETISPPIQSERSEDIVPQGYRLAAGKISSERSEDIVIRRSGGWLLPNHREDKKFCFIGKRYPRPYRPSEARISTRRDIVLPQGKISSECSEDIVIRWAVAGRFPIIGKI